MRLAECLNQSDISNLRNIAKRHTLDVPMYSKNSLLQEILAKFAEPSYVSQRAETLPVEVTSALIEIALDPRERYPRAELLALLKRSQRLRAPEEILQDLLSEGVLFACGGTRDPVYVCPTDVWKRLYTVSTQKLREGLQVATVDPLVQRDDGCALARDAAAFLQYASHHELRLTQEGVIFRRSQMQVLELFGVTEEPLPGHVGWRFGYGRRFHDYPDRFALIVDHLYAAGLIVESAQQLMVDEERATHYLQIGEEERAELLFRFWLRSYRAAIPTLPRLAARIAQLTAGQWVHGDSLTEIVEPDVGDYFYECAQEVLRLRILQMLVVTGSLMLGQSAGDRFLYKLSPRGERWLCGREMEALAQASVQPPDIQRLAIIQPTFEILVPSVADGMFGWDLQALADLVQSEPMRTYVLTRHSLYRGLQAGWTQAKIVEFLHKISAYEVPGSVERTVIGWCEEYGRVAVDVCCVVRCKDAATATEVRAIAPLAGRLREGSGDECLLFSPQDHDLVVATLERLGYLVRVGSKAGNDSVHAAVT
ncbi:MAG: helicase-associated domain-containing protein [Firmicutes bacterium]|nr:helicase-associated domain-containing protein [Bacillota bacterium]